LGIIKIKIQDKLLKYLIDFIEVKKVEQAKVYQDLKCLPKEAKVLQFVCKRFVRGMEETPVLDILQECFKFKGYDYLKNLSTVKRLMDLGWLVQMNFAQMKIQEVSKLEILNTSVSPSISLLRLLEEGSMEVALPEIKPYTDHLEYLQDQFDVIELLHKMSISKEGFTDSSLSLGRLKNKLVLLSKRIEERLKITTEPIVVEEFFKEKKLDDREQKIFLALLKEEYSGGEGQFRDMNILIELISLDEYDKIRNRALLEDGSKLLSEEIIDYEEILNMFGGISRSFYIQEEILQKIIHPNKKKKVTKLKLDKLVEEQEIFEFIKPTTDLNDVVLHPKTRDILNTIIKQLDKDVFAKLKAWGIKDKRKGIDARIIFYGSAGTGKTMTALSLAKTLKRPILSFDCSKILSMYIGESEKNVRKIFDDFKTLSKEAKVDPILLLNEADQFLSSRTAGIGNSVDKMHNQMQNIFLEQIEKFEGILIATTNLLETIDPAFSRRFNYKIEFAKPSFKQRVLLWEKMLPNNASYEKEFDVKVLAKHELSGGQIEVVIKNTALSVAVKDKPIFHVEDFKTSINRELTGAFGESKIMGFSV
jgi:SpoVK/Ycf46/Vps4 family AAA+-type ATPase